MNWYRHSIRHLAPIDTPVLALTRGVCVFVTRTCTDPEGGGTGGQDTSPWKITKL